MGNAAILGPLGSSDIELPFFSFRVPAGFPSPAQDHIEKKISLDELLNVFAPQSYYVRVVGDSMIGVGLFDDDVVIVDRSLEAVSGDVIIGAIDNDPLVKTYIREGNQVILRSENPAYAPRYVLEGEQFEVWGVVKGGLRMFRGHA
ncbi:DNA polymerase V [Pseudomonas sp. BIGb0408]|uniref:DNA polymerase V n=1 Tax=Phytopseudomonas flavescens TaxID=29435 RepID=A0A7Z0BQB6_9GAMM|nr:MULTISPECIES: translesion error-prone DNA polymerase V autoproteolytic subunit [Pseudomonas]MCW2292431.1 DNA polymerase V [Pseudomonas sp. BIGb0408]NYH72998.1 DNA polymerase V [Pseudomonas flavescens]